MSDFYKKIIKNKKTRFKILSLAKFIPDKLMLQIQYFIKCEKKLNLKNPVRYTEKIQWYKLYYRDPVMQQCADKYRVREYVKSKGLGHILNELYGVYNSIDEIDFSQLPEKFVIKTTSGSGTNVICRNKKELEIDDIKDKFNGFREQSSAALGREWVYDQTQSKIIVEKFLGEDKGGLTDYKFFCFRGKISHLIVVSDRFTDEKMDLYDADWNRMNVIHSTCPNQSKDNMPKPGNFEEMKEIAEILSKDFPHVRVDLYNINGRIYFGELTFFSASGYYIFTPDSFDFELGEKFVLPERNV